MKFIGQCKTYFTLPLYKNVVNKHLNLEYNAWQTHS